MPPQPKPMVPQPKQLNVAPSNDPASQEYYASTMQVYCAVNEINPNYKPTVGSAIFEFVGRRVGIQFAPKITGMLIDLPLQQI